MDNLAAGRAARSARHAFTLIFSAFGFFGVAFGTWLVLLAELQAAFALSPAAVGGALTTGLIAAIPVMLLSGKAADRWGAHAVVMTAAGMIGAALLSTALASNYWQLFSCFLLFYGATAAFEVGINASAINFEQESGQRVMSYFHAAFSGFAALSALLIGVLLNLGLPFQLFYVVSALLATVLGLVVWQSGLLATRKIVSLGQGATLPTKLVRTPAVLLLAAIAALAFLAEGELGNWIAIYLRSSLDLSALVGASGFALFHSAMFVGRLLGGQVTQNLERKLVLQLAGITVAGGMLLALSSAQTLTLFAGFLIVGLALSVVTPTVYSLVGNVAPEQSGEASSILTTVGYSGYLVGPVLVGGAAELVGLRLALFTVVVAGSGIALLSAWSRTHARSVAAPGVEVREQRVIEADGVS